MKTASPKALAVLLKVAEQAVPGTYPDGLISDDVSSAIRGLAAVRSPQALELLRRLQRTDGCAGMPDEMPPFLDPMQDYNSLYHPTRFGEEDWRSWPRCWAGLAVRTQ